VETAITGTETRRFVHALRARADAVLIGGKTLRVDNPDLTPRLTGGAHPQVLILSGRRNPDFRQRVFSRGRASAAVLVSAHAPRDLPKWVEHAGLQGGRNLARDLLGIFRDRGYHEVLVEGGRAVWSPFLNAGLCDILYLATAPVLLPRGEGWTKDLRPGWVKPLEFHRFTPLGSDLLAEFRRRDSAP
jgi:diaminohydroxyphosphoribosylaminopyrimidine deaminase/5-amino-6-(5-phosphoribosylamino)uracil reductase